MGICTDRSNSAPPARREHTTRVKTLVLGGPFAAEVRFGRPAVRPNPTVKAAAYPIIVQEPAGGDNLRFDGKVTRTLYLAEIRRPARSHQCFQAAFPPRAHDLYLQIAAARGAPPVVRGPARREGTGVLCLHNGKARAAGRRRRWKRSAHSTAVLHHHEAVTFQPSPLLGLIHAPGRWTAETMGATLGKDALLPQISAAYVKHSVYVQLPFVLPDLRKRYVLGVANEPGGFMIQGGRSLFQRTDAEDDRQAAALRAEGTAGRYCGIGHRCGLNCYCHALPGREKRARRP